MITARSSSNSRSLAIKAILALAGSLVLWASAQVAVPMVPVPITLQTLAIPLIVLALGRNLAVFAVLAYLAEGALGLPVFSGHGGLARLVGPTAGYLWTYPVAAFAVGLLLDRGLDRTYVGRWIAIFAGTGVVFVGGVWWLAVGFHLGLDKALAVGLVPFIIGDILKCSIAAGMSRQDARLFARLGI